MIPEKLPTLKDVGSAAGVTAATASMALRKDPRISSDTQKRVLQAAAKLRYRPDPALAALVSRRKGGTRKTFSNMAVLVDDRWLRQGKVQLWMERFFEGMQRMGQHLGYQVDVFFYPRDIKPGINADRILHSRGIRGIALFPTPGDQRQLALDWEQYALVVIGHPALLKMPHRVGSDPFAAMNMICAKLKAGGYRRAGLAHAVSHERELRYEVLGAITKEKFLTGNRLKIVRPHLPEKFEKAGFLQWVRRERPEVVVTVDEQVLRWLPEGGFQVPEQIGVVFLNVNSVHHPHPSGTSFHSDATGENAVELLHALLLKGETGFPVWPKEVLVYPEWVEGKTLLSRLS
jgi:DNA-binding LacI/PurR family transcriptional regulator